MSITKNASFDIQIPEKYFPAYKIIKPFEAHVKYEVNTLSKEVKVTDVSFPFDCLDKIAFYYSFNTFIRDAAKNNADSIFFDEEIID